MGHTDTEHWKFDPSHQVRCVSELTSQSIEGSDALRTAPHDQRVSPHGLELLQGSRRSHQTGVYFELLESPSYEMIVLAFDVDNRNGCHGYSNSMVAGGFGVMS